VGSAEAQPGASVAAVDGYRDVMIVAVVNFRLDPPLPVAELATSFVSSASRYQDVPGLHRKHFLMSPGGDLAGGVYIWESRDAAAAMYTDEWADRIAAKYGCRPTVDYYDSPVTVDPTSITTG
jgi:Putative mono-oxygenase ydhR